MSSTSNLRTIWLTLRATNYTTAILTSLSRQLDGVMMQQKNMALMQLEMGKSALMAGTMFTVLGQQMGGVGGKVLSMTGQFLQFGGVISMVSGIVNMMSAANMQNTVSVLGMDMSYQMLAVSIAAAFATFLIMTTLLQSFPEWAKIAVTAIGAIVTALLVLYSAEIMASGGLMLFAGLLGVAGGATAAGAMSMISPSTPSYQFGTRMVPATGLAMLHKGEVVYNPSTGRPTGIANESGGGTIIDASMNVETLNTKMDTDDMNDIMRKQARTIAMNNR